MKTTSLFALLPALVILCAAVRAADNAPKYAGSAQCRGCHAEFHRRWSTSRHGLALEPVTGEFVRRELSRPGAAVRGAHGAYIARLSNQGAWIREGNREYRAEYALGGKNIYYFLTTLERGHLQVMPFAYDVRARAWIDAGSSMTMTQQGSADSPVNWRDRTLTFNTSCFGCHVSQLATNYDPATDTYATRWLEPGINCETCHGPSAAHVRAPTAQNIIRLKTMTATQRNDACACCHAKLIPVAANFQSGARFFDYFDLVALESDDYYPDGRDRRENYTISSWLQSACVRSGKLDCLHCHTSSGRYRFAPETAGPEHANDACLPCHEERLRNAAAHSHHAAGTPAARCISCHMPVTEYAHMRRSDHSMRPPTPAATIAYGSPSACTGCHSDKDAAWADRQVRQWTKNRDYQAPTLARAALIDAARKRDWLKLPKMLAWLERRDADEVPRASLIRLLDACRDARVGPAVARAFNDSSPLVRSSVVDTLASRPSPDATAILLTAARDEFRSVRIRAGAALAAAGLESPAVPEYVESLRSRPDDFAGRMNLGVFYADSGQTEKALAEYEFAIRLRPGFAPPLVNAALAYSQLGRNAEAEAALRKAIVIDPQNAAAHLNLGLLLAGAGKLPEAEAALRRSLALDSTDPTAPYNLAVIVSKDHPTEAVALYRKAAALAPGDPKYRAALEYFLKREQAR